MPGFGGRTLVISAQPTRSFSHLEDGLSSVTSRSTSTASPMPIERELPFREFVAAHRDRAIGLAWRLVDGDRAAAEDVVQEAFIRAHRNLHRFRGDSKISTWFYRILVNEAHRYRRWSWIRERVSGGAIDEEKMPSGEAPGDVLLRERVGKAMSELTTNQRETFILVHLEGFTLSECAEITGRALGTNKSHLHRALTKLRDDLSDLDPGVDA